MYENGDIVHAALAFLVLSVSVVQFVLHILQHTNAFVLDWFG